MKSTGFIGAAVAAGLLAVALSGGCEEPRRAREVTPVVRDVPAILRGQIGAEAGIRGIDPVLVSGFGIVVGLNGTGGGPLPVQIQSTMERELARGGIGKGGPLDTGPLAGKSPRQVLTDRNVAVVIVEGVIAPGSPVGSNFDVRVRALPTNCTSLEGGTLWSTDLRLGPATRFGAMRTRRIAEARGPVYINPFTDPSGATVVIPAREIAAIAAAMADAPAAERPDEAPPAAPPGEAPPPPEGDMAQPREESSPPPTDPGLEGLRTPEEVASPTIVTDAVNRQVGRVLAGGTVTDPLALELVLDNPSHARAASMQQAINSRFPPEPGDEGVVARGRNNASIAVRVPRAYRERPGEFVMLLRFMQIDPSFPQEYAKRYAEALKAQPALAEELHWSLQAVGRAAMPFLAPLYDNPEFLPRMAALRAGAKLRDPRCGPYLIELARSGPVGLRVEAIELLGELGADPRVSTALRAMVNEPDLEVRVAAYEALDRRLDPMIDRYRIGDKFVLHVVPSRDGLIYVTQQGKPRIVLFGDDLSLRQPMLASAWSDRFMLKHEGVLPRVYYRDYRSGSIIQGPVPDKLPELVRFMAHRTTPENPEPGLDLSYSEVVGALYEIQKQAGVDAAFATESDRLLAGLMEAQGMSLVEERPESSNRPIDAERDQLKPVAKPLPRGVPGGPRKPTVVPLNPKPPKDKKN